MPALTANSVRPERRRSRTAGLDRPARHRRQHGRGDSRRPPAGEHERVPSGEVARGDQPSGHQQSRRPRR